MAQIPYETVPTAGHGGIADETATPHPVRHRRRECKRSMCASSIPLRRQCARQRNNKFSKNAGLGTYVDLATMLFHHDVVTHGEAEPGSLTGRLGGEEGIEHFLLHLLRDAGAVVADAYF